MHLLGAKVKGENMSRWNETKVCANHMLKIAYPTLKDIDDPVCTIYNNALPSVIDKVFATLYANKYEPVELHEQYCIEMMRVAYKLIGKYGYVKDYGEDDEEAH